MLSTPHLDELPHDFKVYFARAVDNILTGHFFTVELEPAEVAAATTAEQEFTVNGLLTSDVVVVNKPTLDAGLAICGGRVSAANTLAITYINATAGALTPTTESYTIVAIRRERE